MSPDLSLNSQRYRVCMVTVEGQEALAESVSRACPDTSLISRISLSSKDTEQDLERCLETAKLADVILAGWGDGPQGPMADFLKRLRRLELPIIAVCGDDPALKVAALQSGADDVMGLPFHFPLLQARLLAWRRLIIGVKGVLSTGEHMSRLMGGRINGESERRQLGPIEMDGKAKQVWFGGEEVELTPKEFDLLDYLIRRSGECCSRDEILDGVWGINFDTGTNMVDVYVYFLRKKLKAHDLGAALQTVRGRGYRLIELEPQPQKAK